MPVKDWQESLNKRGKTTIVFNQEKDGSWVAVVIEMALLVRSNTPQEAFDGVVKIVTRHLDEMFPRTRTMEECAEMGLNPNPNPPGEIPPMSDRYVEKWAQNLVNRDFSLNSENSESIVPVSPTP